MLCGEKCVSPTQSFPGFAASLREDFSISVETSYGSARNMTEIGVKNATPVSDSASPGGVDRTCKGPRRVLLIRVKQSHEAGLPHSLSLLSIRLTDPRAPPEFPKEGRASPSPGKYC